MLRPPPRATLTDTLCPNTPLCRASFAISAARRQAELDQLEIETDGSTLSIERKRTGWSFRDHDDVDIAITMPRLSTVKLTGSGSITADSADGDKRSEEHTTELQSPMRTS